MADTTHDAAESETMPPTFVAYPILFLFVSLLIGCAVRWVLERFKSKLHINIPYSVVLLTFGGILGGISWYQQRDSPATDRWTISLTIWSTLSPRLILFIFLPALIFEGAMSTDFYIFKQQLPGALMLAFPAMLLQVVLVAMVGLYTFPYGWGWTESLMFGGILSATDPVAVIALMKELGLLSDLRVLIEAESLLNDGTAIVVFELCHKILVHPSDIGTYVSTGFSLVLGAPALGLALFLPAWKWLIKTDDPIQDTVVTVCMAYLAYFSAETSGISGVLTVLTIGLCMSGYGYTAIHTEHARHMLHAVWTIICYVCDTVIFILAGAIIVQDGFLKDYPSEVEHDARYTEKGHEIGFGILLYFFLLLIRVFVVLVCAPIIRYSGYGLQARVCSRKRFFKYMFILSWGGLRGAVGLVLAMIVAQDTHLAETLKDRDPVFSQRVILFTGIVVFLTTLINAASLEQVIKVLGLTKTSQTEEQLKRSAKRFLVRKHKGIEVKLRNRQKYPDLASVDWGAVHELVGPSVVLRGEFQDDDFVVDDEDIRGSDAGDGWDPACFLGRYLMSLRCSYSSQFQNGLLSPAAFRQIEQALKSAIDHANDSTSEAVEQLIAKVSDSRVQLDDFKFEWGWLEYEGFLELPWWLTSLQEAVEPKRMRWKLFSVFFGYFARKWTRHEHARRLEIMLAVARAHEDTLRCELAMLAEEGNNMESVLHVLRDSRCIKEAAQNRYAALQFEQPDISCAVRTRQTCQLVLLDMKEEIDTLHTTAQISDEEFERYEHTIFHKRLHFTHALPIVKGGGASDMHLLSYYFSQEDLDHFSHAELSAQNYSQGQTICIHHQEADSMFFIARGMARVSKDAFAEKRDDILLPVHSRQSPDADAATGQDGDKAQDQSELSSGRDGEGADELGRPPQMSSSFVIERSSVEHPIADRHKMMLSAGCCFNDVEFLLYESGFVTENFGRMEAVTDVRLFQLRFDHLRAKPEQCHRFLQKLWRDCGPAVALRCPQAFNFMPPDDWSWSKTVVSTFPKGARLRFLCAKDRTCVLLVQGRIEHLKAPYFPGSYTNVCGTDEGVQKPLVKHHQPISFFIPQKGDSYTVVSETCKLLSGEGDTIVAHGDHPEDLDMVPGSPKRSSSTAKLRRRSTMTLVERRSLELVRGKPSVDTVVAKRNSSGMLRSLPFADDVEKRLFDRAGRRISQSTDLDNGHVDGKEQDRCSKQPFSLGPRRVLPQDGSTADAPADTVGQEDITPEIQGISSVPLSPMAAAAAAAAVAAQKLKPVAERLADLKELREQGLIDQKELDEQRAVILAAV